MTSAVGEIDSTGNFVPTMDVAKRGIDGVSVHLCSGFKQRPALTAMVGAGMTLLRIAFRSVFRRNPAMRLAESLLSIVIVVSLAGCSSPTYYRVTDPTTGRVYYTKAINRFASGAISLSDAATGSDVSLQNSEVITVNQQTYEANMHASGKVPSAPTPAPAPAPAANPK